jgi:chromate reductase, NAD(P)H dehydrogenase (quinone)
MKVLGISGSLRRGSHNTTLLRAAAELLPPPVELELFDGLKAVEPYDEDDDPAREPGGGAADRTPRASAIGKGPVGARRLREAIDRADAVLIATPEYNQSLPGQLKNALDWVSRPFPDNVLRGKPVAVVGASTGMFGAVWSQAEVRKVLAASGASVIDEELPVGHADEAFTGDGRLADPDLRERYTEILDELVAQAEQLALVQPVAA